MPAERPLFSRLDLIFTCEHGGNEVPLRYRALLAGWERRLETHRGYDPGALEYARQLARAMRAPLFYSKTTRLVVDLNRSIGHPRCFSPRTRRLPANERRRILERYYLPYRQAVEKRVRAGIRRGRRVLHISCHSFTPRLAGEVRKAEVGFLFDPRRAAERDFCSVWLTALHAHEPGLRLRRNYPYRGYADGLITALRGRFPPRDYVGVELEVNQKFPLGNARRWKALRAALTQSLREALAAS